MPGKGNFMAGNKKSLEEELTGKSYQELGEYFDNHSATEFWDETTAVSEEIETDPVTGQDYYLIEPTLSAKLRALAKQQNLSAGELLNSWLREKLKDVEV